MKKFARLFELSNGNQVLLTLGVNNKTEDHEITIRTDLKGYEVSVIMIFEEYKMADKFMKSYSLKKAIAFRKGVI